MLVTQNIVDVSTLRETLCLIYQEERFTEDRGKLVEVNAAQFIADEPSVFGAPDLGYIEREKRWYLSQSLNIKDIPPPIPRVWQQVADEDGFVNSNYGWAVFSPENHHQFQFVMATLRRDPMSRRAVIQFNRPSMTDDFQKNGRNDYMCTYAYQFFIRAGQLDMLVYMRSMDVVYGYPNDRAWAQFVWEHLLGALNKPEKRYDLGTMVWHCGSAHVYQRHFYLIDYYIETGEWNVDKKEAKLYVEGTSTPELG